MPEDLYPAERRRLEEIRERVAALRELLVSKQEPLADAPPSDWFDYLSEMKQIQGNSDNGLAFISTLMARDYLKQRLPIASFDAGEKPQGAKGLDIDVETVHGARVIAEIKATVPYKGTRLGAQQYQAWLKDFDKLNREVADHKYFFVTDPISFDIVRELYAAQIPGVIAVLLKTGEEFACIDGSAKNL